MRKPVRLAVTGGLVLALALTACSKNTGNSGGTEDSESGSLDIIGTAADAIGPATPMAGATAGGTVEYKGKDDFTHLDPARSYVGSYMMVGEALLYRTLTGYREDIDANGKGSMKLVGDLATDSGTDVNGDCKTWDFTLKSGLKYEDGSEIKAEDVAYGIARAFSPDLGEGAQFLMDWLQPSREYKGPYDGAEKVPPGVTVTGNKITFTFDQARCETPFAVAMPYTAPVPAAKDTKANYDTHPFSSGPYKIEKRVLNDETVLVRNGNWDANTDPIRHAYPDKWHFTWGAESKDLTQRLIANAGGDENMMTMGQVYPELLPNVTADLTKFEGRVLHGPQKYNGYVAINNLRIKDVDVRRALNYAFPKAGYIQLDGGEWASKPLNGFITPDVPGYKEFDAYPNDVDKAKQLLQGKTVGTLRYAYSEGSDVEAQKADMIKTELAKAGITVETVMIPSADWYGQIGDPKNDFDMYASGWGADWPSGATDIPPCLGEAGLDLKGNTGTNYAFFTAPDVEAEITRINGLPITEALPAWGELDQKVMTDYAPYIPISYSYGVWLSGSNIGGQYLQKNLSTIDMSKIFLKDPKLNA